MNFKMWLENLESMSVQGGEVLVYQYSPNIQIQSGVGGPWAGDAETEYFQNVFGKGKPSDEMFDEFIHSYFSGNSNDGRMARIIFYLDGKIVIGKAPYHAYLSYHGERPGIPAEGYYNLRDKKLTITNVPKSVPGFSIIQSWKNIINNLKNVGLIDDSWTIRGCPPVCDEDSTTIGELMNFKGSLETGDRESHKEREASALAALADIERIKKLKQDNNTMGFMYRRLGDHSIYN